MFSFEHSLSIFMVGRESIKENWILLADTQEKHETAGEARDWTWFDSSEWKFTWT
jgi:hypothetical protein